MGSLDGDESLDWKTVSILIGTVAFFLWLQWLGVVQEP